MRHNVLQILSNVTDVRLEDLNLDSTLDELGIGSLMATEALNYILGRESDYINTRPSRSTECSIVDLSRPQEGKAIAPAPLEKASRPTIVSTIGAFFTNATGGGKFRILEVDTGTEGTTRYITSNLRNHGIPFDPGNREAGHDRSRGGFHCIIATNCIHATRTLEVSLSHLRRMLRENGALTLIEIKNTVFGLGIVVGLFEGWWLVEDDRLYMPWLARNTGSAL
ncbi:hypothetical protein GGS24DRAFT_500499 [Hypoxylon argillaceum]|nr:hypothetical protein GGS24DRAFT_500499 [Hypoxylon argillaceum]